MTRFYGTEAVPSCDHWDHHERQPRPRAPYLLQGAKDPSPLGIQTIRARLRAVSIAAGARRADNRPLVLLPHDCRRVFASEHLNNNVSVHVIQALLGHATLDTIMVYAKLYPTTLIEEYRKAVCGLYNAFHGDDSLRNPTADEWAAFTVSCNFAGRGHASLRAADRRVLPERARLPGVHARAAQAECGADLPSHARQP